MTNEEAINELRDRYLSISAFADKEACNKANKAIDMAIQALEKQIPKKVTEDEAFGQCPVCGYAFNSELVNEYDIKYCPFCGQTLDFSERSNTDEN